MGLGPHLVPTLIEWLDKAVASPSIYVRWAEEGYSGHLYALALLAFLGEPKAHPVILELARLPEPVTEALLGAAVGELLPAALYRTCDRALGSVQQLATDAAAPLHCRDAALGALVLAVLDGAADRVDVLRYFGELITEADRAKADMDFVTCVVTRSCDLYPDEIREAVEQAFRRGRVDPFGITLAEVERILDEDRETVLSQSRQSLPELMPREVHGYLTRWATFEEVGPPRDDATREAKARQRALEKKRREQRKRARKARRRRK